jgi:hypothetical protein
MRESSSDSQTRCCCRLEHAHTNDTILHADNLAAAAAAAAAAMLMLLFCLWLQPEELARHNDANGYCKVRCQYCKHMVTIYDVGFRKK